MTIRAVSSDGVREVTLPAAGVFSVGRRAGNDLVVNGAGVSRQHARFRIEGGRILVEDAGSSHGTVLNGKAISAPAEVRVGDVVGLGDVRLELVGDLSLIHI